MGHLAASGCRRDEPPWQKAGGGAGELQRMHIKTANPAVQSLPQDRARRPAVRDGRHLRGRSERAEALAGLLDWGGNVAHLRILVPAFG